MKTLRFPLLGVLTLAGSLLGCAEEPGRASAPLVDPLSGSSAPAPITAPTARDPLANASEPTFDMASAIERARASFFMHDGAYVAGTETHRVELEGDAISFFPAHDTARESLLPRGRNARPDAPSLTATTTRIDAATPLTARTEWIGRGAARSDAQVTETRTEDGALLLRRGAIIETLRNTQDGLEQSWMFASAPAGDGELLVRIGTQGMSHIATTPSGEHFADSSTGLGARYGHGTFIDAAGVRTAVPVSYEGGSLVLRVPSDVIDGAAYPAVLDPTISAELTIDTPVNGPRGGNQVQPAIASSGTNYLLVFVDGLFGSDDIRGARFGADGTLLDGSSFPIATEESTQFDPAVTWNGTRWIVAWQDGRNGVDWEIYGTTVSATGAVGALDGAAMAATAGVDDTDPVLSSAGAISLLAYTSGDDTTNSDILGRRISVAGAVTDGTAIIVGGGAGAQHSPAVVGSATQFLVSYTDANGTASVRVRRVAASGTALVDAAPTLIATGGVASTVGFGGGATYLVLWTTLETDNFFAIQSGTVPVTGPISAPTATMISPDAVSRDYLVPEVAWNGSEYLAVFSDRLFDDGLGEYVEFKLSARRLNATGIPVGAALNPSSGVAGDVTNVDVSAIGAAFYVVYADFSGEATDIRGTRIAGTTVSSPAGQVLSFGPNDEESPVVAGNGTVWGVAWTDFRSGEVDAWAAILGATGAVVGTPSSIAGGPGSQTAEGLAWSGSRFVVVIADGGQDVRALTMTAAGIASAPVAVAISTTLVEFEPSVACGPASIGCLVSWTSYDPAATTIDAQVRASRVDGTTASLTVAPAVNVITAAGNQFDSATAASSAGFFITWTDARVDTNVDIRGTRFVTSPLDAAGIVVGGAAGAQADSVVASDGTDFLVGFVDARAGASAADIYFQRVNGASGALLGANVVASASADVEVQPAVGFSGRYLLAWVRASGANTIVEATRIATSGTVIDSTPLSITEAVGNTDQPGVSGGTGGRWLVTYRNVTGGPGRARARLVTDDLSNGDACSSPLTCASGFCVDGVCCASACAGGTTDCNACSVAAGSSADGVCAPITGCGVADAGVDSGIDAGGIDAGGTDGGTIGTDSGTIDTDSGTIDTDSGTIDTDSGIGTDSGIIGADGGPIGTDTGIGGTDAGPRVDAGGGTESGGCGCSVPAPANRGAAPAMIGSALLGLALMRRRR
jgi:hypothetical protein